MTKTPKMQRAHFTLIAETLKSERPDRDGNAWSDGARDEWSTTVLAFARALASTNPGFDRERFLAACGYPAPGPVEVKVLCSGLDPHGPSLRTK